mgnify:CR=1 FL=1
MSDEHASLPTQETEPLGISIKLVVLISVVFTLLLVTIIAATQAGVRYAYQRQAEQRWMLPNRELAQLEREQREHINRYGVVDPQAGLYTIPIDQAMEAVADQR